MDKQQAAEAQTDKISWNDFPDLAQMIYVQALVKDATIAGWEAHEAQCPGDAVAFLEWAEMNGVTKDACDEWTVKGHRYPFTPDGIYKLFNPSGAAPQETSGFDLSKDDLQKLLGECLKPEEIAGDASIQHGRVKEIILWFWRYAQGRANPKWFRAHAFELAYYIATNAGNRFIDLTAVKQKGWLEGINITSSERSLAERMGLVPVTGPVWVDKNRRQWMRKEAIAIFELTKGYTPEQRALFDNAMKGMEDMAGHVLELTNEPESAPQVFTREQVDAMLKDTIRHFNSIYGLPPADAAYVDKWIEGTLTECLDTNYSPLNK